MICESMPTLKDLVIDNTHLWINCKNRDCLKSIECSVATLIWALGAYKDLQEIRRDSKCPYCGCQDTSISSVYQGPTFREIQGLKNT
mgnify:FL=1